MDAITAVRSLGAGAGADGLTGRLVHVEVLPGRPSRFADPVAPLHPGVVERLAARGITRLWAHQAAALDALGAGRSIVVVTGTGSGKSLCWQVPIVGAALAGRRDTALLVFPTKALAHDQLRSLWSWMTPGLRAVTYDGDTPVEDRAELRRRATVVLTNPDMLHGGMLPYHQRWASFFRRLQLVVIDELHTLRGVFGSHVAHLLRRLRRVCAHYGSSPTFCFASATIGNPAELASTLCGLPVAAIDGDGSPAGERLVALWDRSPVPGRAGILDADDAAATGDGPAADGAGSEDGWSPPASAATVAGGLLARFVADGLRTIAFCPSRRGAEVVAGVAQRRLDAAGQAQLSGAVAAYRGGFLPAERRQLEGRLAAGELLGVAATNALELGIDVAGLDVVVLCGFPGTLASFWQQAGRAGRAGRPAAAVLVAGDDQLDRWYLDHPAEIVTRAIEPAVVNPSNPFIARPQVGCAAYELPLTPDDPVLGHTARAPVRDGGQAGGDGADDGPPVDPLAAAVDDAVLDLTLDDALVPRGGRMLWSGPAPPAPSVGLRRGGSAEFRLVDADSGRLIGTVDGERVLHVAHPGAIYTHQGATWRVARLDLGDGWAALEPFDGDEYTVPRHDVDVAVIGCDRSRGVGRSELHLGSVEVTTTTTSYQRRRVGTGRAHGDGRREANVIETVRLDLPPRTLVTRASWYAVPFEVVGRAGLDPGRILGAVHAAEHTLIGMLPLFAICDRWDVGGVSMALHPATGTPTIFVYDGYAGGAGIAELAYEAADRHLAAAADAMASCRCAAGCPSCVQSPKCGNGNEHLDKAAAIALTAAVLGR